MVFTTSIHISPMPAMAALSPCCAPALCEPSSSSSSPSSSAPTMIFSDSQSSNSDDTAPPTPTSPTFFKEDVDIPLPELLKRACQLQPRKASITKSVPPTATPQNTPRLHASPGLGIRMVYSRLSEGRRFTPPLSDVSKAGVEHTASPPLSFAEDAGYDSEFEDHRDTGRRLWSSLRRRTTRRRPTPDAFPCNSPPTPRARPHLPREPSCASPATKARKPPTGLGLGLPSSPRMERTARVSTYRPSAEAERTPKAHALAACDHAQMQMPALASPALRAMGPPPKPRLAPVQTYDEVSPLVLPCAVFESLSLVAPPRPRLAPVEDCDESISPLRLPPTMMYTEDEIPMLSL